MEEMMFEKASRLKLRFITIKGDVTVEDLWDMKLTSRNGFDLDSVAKSLNTAVKESGEESFVVKRNTKNAVLELKFEIVKHIIDVKIAEAEASERAVEIKAEKEMYDGLIAEKENDGRKEMCLEDLKKKRAAL